MKALLLCLLAAMMLPLGCRSGKNTAGTSSEADWKNWKHPDWLRQEIAGWEAEGPQNPPIRINLYQYQSDTVVHITAPCCDQFSRLLDMEGTLLCHPDGGITGRGDGKCPDFIENATWLHLVWEQSDPQH